MLKHSNDSLAFSLTESPSATKDIKERIRNASHIADGQGLKRVVSCLSLAMHILEEEEKGRNRPLA
jgi:hypothetical protein